MHKLWILFVSMGLCAQNLDINTGTKGTLNVNRGGTGATTAGAGLANLGGISASSTDILTNKTLTNPKINAILDPSNASVVLQILSTTGATEGFSMTPSTSGNPPILNSFGSGSNVDMTLDPKGTGILRLPIADEIQIGDGVAGQVLAKAANGRSQWLTLGSGGTVTSVGLSGIASFITVSGSPVTTSGTLALALASQTQNLIFASPNGSSGAPSFRAMVAADVPSLDAAKISTGVLATARVVSGTVTNSRCLHVDGSGNVTVTASDCGSGSGGLTSVNSEIGPGITITSGTSGSDFGIATTTNTITVNCPTASGSNRGCLSTADWTSFSGKVSGPGMPTVLNNFAVWADTSGLILGTGFAGSTASVVNTVAMRDSNGDLYAAWFRGGAVSVNNGFFVGTGGGVPVITARRDNDAFVGPDVLQIKNFANTATLSAIDWNGNFTGKSATTDAFASNPANCAVAGQAAAGITAAGVAEGCFTPTGANGLSIYNVKDAAYGALGDGSNDDTSEIQAAINACQDSTRGGIVYFPPGTYNIASGLVHGNGSTSGASTASTKAVCRFEGAGAGDDPIGFTGGNMNISVIKWTGSNPGSLTYMLTLDGPMAGTGVEHLKLWANGNSNVVGLDLRQVAFSQFSDVVVSDTGGGPSGGAFAVKIWAQKSFSHFACFNTIENMRVRPATNSVGSGLWVGGDSTYGTACSINITGGYFNRDDNYVSGTNTATYGVLLDSSDNFHAAFTHFSDTGGNSARNGCSIGASIGDYAGAGAGVYPDSAHFYGISSGGMCGTTGSGRPFVVWGGECGADGQGSCDYHNAFTGGGTKPISLSGESDASLKGMGTIQVRYLSTDENYKTVLINHASGGQNGAGNLYFQREGVDIGRIKSHYYDGLGLYVGDGAGTGTLNERLRLRNNGIITPSSVSFSDLGGEPTGSYAYCSNCQVTSGADNTCATGGAGAFAWKVNGTWRCFAAQN